MRLKLRNWLKFLQYQRDIQKEKGQIGEIILRSLSLSLVDVEREDRAWWEVAEEYTNQLAENKLAHDFPILRPKQEEKEFSWNYEGREWYFWVHLFADNYGWTIEYVAELDPDDVIALYQEIELNDQFRREWEHSLSEIAYPYNKSTKKQEYKPIGRPKWMIEMPNILIPGTPQAQRKIPKHFYPAGYVIKVDHEDTNPEHKAGV